MEMFKCLEQRRRGKGLDGERQVNVNKLSWRDSYCLWEVENNIGNEFVVEVEILNFSRIFGTERLKGWRVGILYSVRRLIFSKILIFFCFIEIRLKNGEEIKI